MRQQREPGGIGEVTAAIILAGSYVWSEDSFESLCPRALLPVANAPLIAYVQDWLKKADVTTVAICASDLAGLLLSDLQRGAQQELDLYYCEDRIPRGPAGCSHDAAAIASADQYIVVDGSVIPDVDLRALLRFHQKSDAAATVVVDQAAHGPEDLGPHLSPAGVCVFAQRALERVPPTGYQDVKEMLIPQLHQQGELVIAFPTKRPTVRVDSLESYLAIQGWMLARLCRGELTPAEYERRDLAWIHRSAQVAESARLVGPVMLGADTCIEEETIVIGPSVLGNECSLGRRSVVERSVMWDGCSVGPGARIDQCLVVSGASIEPSAFRYGVIAQAHTMA